MTVAPLLPALVAAGRTDAEIAAALGVNREYVGQVRRHLGLPCNRRCDTPDGKARRRAVLAATVARHGPLHRLRTRTPDGHRPERERVAGRYNLPADLPLTQVRVVLALAAGPLTTAQLAARVKPHRTGPAYKRFAQSAVAGRNHLAALVARGLAVRVQGFRSATYLLTPRALSLLDRTESPS